MDARTEKALRESIVKWEKNAAVENLKDTALGPYFCPLCNLFNNRTHSPTTMCIGCPVYDKIGHIGCQGTPYDDVLEADSEDNQPAFLEAAQREVDFLKSLLPEAQS